MARAVRAARVDHASSAQADRARRHPPAAAFVRNVLVSMRDRDASLFAGIVRITWRRVVRDAGLL